MDCYRTYRSGAVCAREHGFVLGGGRFDFWLGNVFGKAWGFRCNFYKLPSGIFRGSYAMFSWLYGQGHKGGTRIFISQGDPQALGLVQWKFDEWPIGIWNGECESILRKPTRGWKNGRGSWATKHERRHARTTGINPRSMQRTRVIADFRYAMLMII
jgi:hypothetical protein